MVATVSARKNIASAVQYFTHLNEDDYYLKNDSVGYWFGKGAEFLGLKCSVSREGFSDALSGRNPSTGEPLIRVHKRSAQRQPGWDVCMSAPKGVSILMALAPNRKARRAIVRAHRNAVKVACGHIEENYAVCRRGKGGRQKEKTAGLLFSVFDHYTSRSLCPQIHSHVFVHNLAPRGDTSWGGIISKPLYSAQKEIGAIYRKHLHKELQNLRIPSRLGQETICIDGVDRNLEMAFSVRRQQILKAMREYEYARTPEGFQKAALRTRQNKRAVPLDGLLRVWQKRAIDKGMDRNAVAKIWANISLEEQEPPRSRERFLSVRSIKVLALAARNFLRKVTPTANLPRVQDCKRSALVLFRMAKGGFNRLERQYTHKAFKN